MTYLLRRAPLEVALSALADNRGQGLDEVAAALPNASIAWETAPLGGAPVPEPALRALRGALLTAAADLGYPSSSPSTALKGRFDRVAGELLHEHLPMTPNEAAAEDVWNYLTAAWLLDLCAWRWGWDGDPDRFTGHRDRGQFRRVWWREYVLGAASGDESLVAHLGEEELVNVMERPTLTRDRRVARALVRVYLVARTNLGGFRDLGLGRQAVMRSFARRVLRLTPFVALDFLDKEQLDGVLVGVLQEAINSQVPPSAAVALADLAGASSADPQSGSPQAPGVIPAPPAGTERDVAAPRAAATPSASATPGAAATRGAGTLSRGDREALINRMSSVPPSVYFALAAWASDADALTPMRRKAAYDFGEHVGRRRKLSLGQAATAAEILREAEAAGFRPDAGSSKRSSRA